jgi:hypothetical protein
MNEKSFVDLGREIGQLLEAKNLAYGNSFERSEEIIRILYPDGIPVQAYQDALAMIRIIDKLFRIANAKGAFGEDPWRDIAGYAILSLWSASKDTVQVEDNTFTVPPDVLEKLRVLTPAPIEVVSSTGTAGVTTRLGGLNVEHK